MKEIFESLFKIISEFTFRRFFSLIVVLVIACGVLVIYERITASITLNKIQKGTEILAQLHELGTKPTLSAQEKQIYEKLINQLQTSIISDPLSIRVISMPIIIDTIIILKFIFSSLLFLIIAIFYIKGFVKKEKEKQDAFLGFILFAVISGIIGIFMPLKCWPYLHLFVYPLIPLAVLMFVGIIALVIESKKKTK